MSAERAPRGVRVSRSVYIPWDEITLTFSPSGGPGGQHANKASTRAELEWNVEGSSVLGPRQRERVQERLAHRIDRSGVLRLTSDRYRSQLRNREDVIDRLATLVGEALIPRRPRVPTAPGASAHGKRLRAKKRRSEIKKQRRAPLPED